MAQSSLLNTVLQSFFFRRANGKAGRYARNTSKLLTLVQQVFSKTNRVDGRPDALLEFRRQATLLGRLVRAYARGEYRVLPWKSLLLIIAVLLYFVNPLDLLPDFLPLIGFADDIALVLWLFKTISGDIAKFEAWENSRTVSID